MNPEQTEFYDHFSQYQLHLPDSVDSPTAFFCAVNYVIRATPFESVETVELKALGFTTRLLYQSAVRIGGLVRIALRRVRLIHAAPNSCK